MRTPLYKRYIGILLGRFPGRYTRPKTGIFSRSQYELSHLQNFVLRHIGGIAPRLSRDCPISRRTAHVHARRNFPKNFSQFFASRPALTRRIRTVPQESAEPRKTPAKPLLCYLPQKFFQKIFSKFFSKILRPSGACVKMRKMLDREKFFANFFSKNFWNFIQSINTPPVRS